MNASGVSVSSKTLVVHRCYKPNRKEDFKNFVYYVRADAILYICKMNFKKYNWNLGGKLFSIDRPKVMGILNMTPDSFYDGGFHEFSFQDQIQKMIAQKVDIIDIGGMSSRPGAQIISSELEWSRVEEAIYYIQKNHADTIISIDTIHAEVAEKSAQQGVHIINDISGGTYQEAILEVAARHKMPFVIMHRQGDSANMQDQPQYDDVVAEVYTFLYNQVQKTRQMGVLDIAIDVGFGFGKTQEQNFLLAQNLDFFHQIQVPLLVGISRKSMLYKTLQIQPSEALAATSAMHMYLLQKQAHIYRVHDVQEMQQCIQLNERLSCS